MRDEGPYNFDEVQRAKRPVAERCSTAALERHGVASLEQRVEWRIVETRAQFRDSRGRVGGSCWLDSAREHDSMANSRGLRDDFR